MVKKSEIFKAIAVVIAVTILLMVGVAWLVEKSPSSPTRNKYKICRGGFMGTCLYTNEFREVNGCAIAENGDKLCGIYSIRQNK